ncbi:MotB family protein [Neorhizobium sp. NCHU2750]|uniref:MotB family protein n=1 Tax=Neorhizobium sp. NCHU2750 TaxID=1825976 RepID=UPI000E722C9D|nr:flagellar motor protein [Neorhizobium sp. NCHU2750]
MSESHHHGKNEIIVVKRHKGDHDGAHGGAWKIAYADFMTAMMAFFLVMWLVNASNEETKASIASYFNPIKLTDETPASEGVKNPANEAQGEQDGQKSDVKADKSTNGAAAASGEDLAASSGDNTSFSENAFFQNPYAVLAEIAQEVGQQANVSVKGEGGASNSGPSTGASGGQAYRDPFDPDFWSKQVAGAQANQSNGETGAVAVSQDSKLPDAPQVKEAKAEAQSQNQPDAKTQPPADAKPQDAQQMAALQPAAAGNPTDAAKGQDTKTGGKPDVGKADKTADKQETHQASAEETKKAEELKTEIVKAMTGVPGKLAEGIVVTPSEGGLLLSISDQVATPMFDLGSAVPRRETVLAMEKVAEVLKNKPGSIVIRGHTDSKPYHGGKDDNWTLSMDRAHAAYFMLMRGGLDESRVKQLSGFADRRPQTTDNPDDGANRRIEILIADGSR